ncbi:MAG TPA: UUP1 family membrane protein, partial [Steroidobacteraceae bacterium]
MRNRHIFILAAVLTVISVSLVTYKVRVLDYPLLPREQRQVWNIEAAISFDPGPAAVKATLKIPTLTPGFSVLDEYFISRGFGVSTRVTPAGREAEWAVRQASGPQTVYYRAVVYKDPQRIVEDTTPPFPPRPQLDEPSRIAMEGLIAEARRQSADVASFTVQLLRRINQGENDPYVSVFLDRRATPSERAELATMFLAGAQIPARVAHGIALRDKSGRVQTDVLLEVHDGVQWLYFDPVTTQQGLPPDFLIWWRGDERIANLEGGSGLEVTLAVQPNLFDAMMIAERRAKQLGSRSADFSLSTLPITTQTVYS